MSGRAGRIFGAMALALGLVLTTGVALSQTAAPAAPARAMLDVTPESIAPEGKRPEFLAKSDPRFHQIQVATVPTKVTIPGGNNFGSGQ